MSDLSDFEFVRKVDVAEELSLFLMEHLSMTEKPACHFSEEFVKGLLGDYPFNIEVPPPKDEILMNGNGAVLMSRETYNDMIESGEVSSRFMLKKIAEYMGVEVNDE